VDKDKLDLIYMRVANLWNVYSEIYW
jgi:hypothetical protein